MRLKRYLYCVRCEQYVSETDAIADLFYCQGLNRHKWETVEKTEEGESEE